MVSKPKIEARQPDPGQRKAAQSNGRRRRLAHVSDEQIDQHDPEHADRDVDEEDPAPRGIGRR